MEVLLVVIGKIVVWISIGLLHLGEYMHFVECFAKRIKHSTRLKTLFSILYPWGPRPATESAMAIYGKSSAVEFR